MLDEATFFSHLIIALKDDDLNLFRRFYHSLPSTDKKKALNLQHQPDHHQPYYHPGYTPLMYAAQYHNNNLLEYLLKDCGADPHLGMKNTNLTPYPHAALIALSQGNLMGFDLCLQYGHPQRLIQQHREVDKAALHVLISLLSTSFGDTVFQLNQVSTLRRIIHYSHTQDLQNFIQAIEHNPSLHPSNRRLLLNLALSQCQQSDESVFPDAFGPDHPFQIPSNVDTPLLLPPIPNALHRSRPRALTDSQRHNRRPIPNPAKLGRSNSLSMIDYIGNPPPVYTPPVTQLPPVPTHTFIRLFQSKFMRHFLDALLSQDISNFGDTTDTVYTSVKETVDSLTGISSTVADSIMSIVSASKNASICATVRKAAKLLIMAEGPSGLNENACYDEEPDPGSAAAPLVVGGQDDPLDGIKLSRTKQARMNHISARLASKILATQTNLTSLSYEAMLQRIDVMIKKIFQFIGSDRFNPMVAGFNNEIAAIVGQLYHGYLEPHDYRNRAQRVMAERAERSRQEQFGYYHFDPSANKTRYFIPKNVLFSKQKFVSHFRPLPPSYNLKQYPEATQEQALIIMRKQVIFYIIHKLKEQQALSQAGITSAVRKALTTKLHAFFKTELMDALFIPEKNDQYRRHLIHLTQQIIAQYAFVVSKPRKICYLSIFQKKLAPQRQLFINYQRAQDPSGSLLPLMTRLKMEIKANTQLKPFSLSALKQSPTALTNPRRSRFSLPNLPSAVIPYEPLSQLNASEDQRVAVYRPTTPTSLMR